MLKAMQFVQKQPQMGETIEDLIWNEFEEMKDERGEIMFRGLVTPQMTSQLGTMSEGVLMTLMTKAAFRVIQEHKKGDLVLENMSIYFVRPQQIETEIDIKTQIIEVSRKFGKVEVTVVHQGNLIAKALLTAQLIDQS